MRTIRRWLFGILLFALLGTGAELVSLGHYEDAWQWAPLLLIVLAGVVLVWHRARTNPGSARAVRITMILFLAAGVAGLGLHFRGAAEFQWEIDPSISTSDLVMKAIRAKAPPFLAPGALIQLGLLGLVYVYKYDDPVSME